MSNSFAIPWTVACQGPLSIGFPRQEYWHGSLFPSSEELPDPGIERPGRASGKEPRLTMQETQETWVRSLSWEDLLEKEKATHSSILAWRIPWTEELGGLQSIGSQRVRHD